MESKKKKKEKYFTYPQYKEHFFKDSLQDQFSVSADPSILGINLAEESLEKHKELLTK